MTSLSKLLCPLFVPADRPDRYWKAAASGASLVIIDLEDAVSSERKDSARSSALQFLIENPSFALRINPPGTPAGIADLHALLSSTAMPEFVLIPKVQDASQVTAIDALMTASNKDTHLIALIESARGLSRADQIAGASGRLRALMLGVADLAADLGSDTGWEPLAYARSRIVVAAAVAGIAAIDSPFFDVSDASGLSVEAALARSFGFEGKAAVHPYQVSSIAEAFRPTTAQLAGARAIVAKAALGVGVIDGSMVDEAMAKRARRILANAED